MKNVSGPTRTQLNKLSGRAGRNVLSKHFTSPNSSVSKTGYDVAEAWEVEHPLECLCLVIPTQLACAVLNGSFHCVMIAARQMRRNSALFADWPPKSFFKTRAVTFLQPKQTTQQEMLSDLRELHADLVKWKPHIVSIPRPLDEQPLIEARLDQHMHLLHNLQVSFSGTVDPSACKAYPSIQFLESLLASWLLRTVRDMKPIARHIVTVCVPSYLQAAMHKRIEQPMSIPSKICILYGQTSLDLAFSRLCEIFSPPGGGPPPAWWLWADSSPMGGHNWQLCYMHYATCASDSDWLLLARSHHELCKRNVAGTDTWANFLDNDEGNSDFVITSDAEADDPIEPKPSEPSATLRVDDGEFDFSSSDEGGEGDAARVQPEEVSQMSTQKLTRVVCDNLSYHTPMPQALGQRAATMPHKTSCVCSSFRFATSGAKGLDNCLQAGVSGTFDLGVEYGVADVPYADFDSHFSENLQPSRIARDDGEMGADFEDNLPEERAFLFSHMLPIAALLHIIDGLEKDLHESLPGFSGMMTHLLAVMGLLCYEGPKNAFVHRVVQGGGFNRYTMHFQQTFPLFTEQRWRSFVDTIDWLLPLRPFLVETWNPHLFGQFKSKIGRSEC